MSQNCAPSYEVNSMTSHTENLWGKDARDQKTILACTRAYSIHTRRLYSVGATLTLLTKHTKDLQVSFIFRGGSKQFVGRKQID